MSLQQIIYLKQGKLHLDQFCLVSSLSFTLLPTGNCTIFKEHVPSHFWI